MSTAVADDERAPERGGPGRWRGVLWNPVLAREMRTRMRGRRAAVLVTVWLVFNGGVLAVVYLAAENVAEARFGFGGFANVVAIGRGVYEWTLFGMLLLMLLIIPAQAAGAIAGERERRTLIPLQVTLLSPSRILIGKLTASVAFLVLLVVAALPLLAVGYLVGGVGITDVVTGAAAVVASGLLVAGMCIAVSTFVRRVQAATVLCYALVMALTGGTLLAYGAYAVIDQSRGVDEVDPPAALLLANPAALVSDVVGDIDDDELPSPFDGLHLLVNDREEVVADAPAVGPGFGPEFGGGFGVEEVQEVEARRADGPRFWMGSAAMLVLCTVGAMAGASLRLRTPAGGER